MIDWGQWADLSDDHMTYKLINVKPKKFPFTTLYNMHVSNNLNKIKLDQNSLIFQDR